MDNFNLYFSKDLLTRDDLSPCAICAYCGLRIMGAGPEEKILANSFLISHALGKPLSVSRGFLKKMSTGLDELIAKNIVSVVSSTPTFYELDCSTIRNNPSEGFCAATLNDVYTIMRSSYKNTDDLLVFFLYLLTTIDYTKSITLGDEQKNNFVGCAPSAYLAGKLGVAEKTIISRFKALEELKLIYVRRVVQKTLYGEIRNRNYYGIYENQHIIDLYVNRLMFTNPGDVFNRTESGSITPRALAQMYNKFCRCMASGEEPPYSPDEIQQIYDYVSEQNDFWRKHYEKSGDAYSAAKIRDLSVFDVYQRNIQTK